MALEKAKIQIGETKIGPIQSKIAEGKLFDTIHQVNTLPFIIPVDPEILDLGLTLDNIANIIQTQNEDRASFGIQITVGEKVTERSFQDLYMAMPNKLGEVNNNKGNIVFGADGADSTYLEQNPNRMGQVEAFHTLVRDDAGHEAWLITKLNWKESGEAANKKYEYMGDNHFLVVDTENQPAVVDLDEYINNQQN